MCWSEEVSLQNFLFGTFISGITAYNLRHVPAILALTISWHSVIMMQFFEWYAWGSINNEDDGMFGTYGAVFTSLLQPPIMGIVLLTVGDVPRINRLISSGLIITYIYWYSHSLVSISPLEQLGVHDPLTCTHIDFVHVIDLPALDYMYPLTLYPLFLLLIRPIDLALALTGFTMMTFCLSYLLYNCGENNASMWCWISSSTMGFVGIYWKIFHDKSSWAPSLKYFG